MRIVVIAIAAVLVAVVAGFLAYASSPMMAEEGPLARAEIDGDVTEIGRGCRAHAVPARTATGLIFFAGARVDPAAYANKLSGVAESGITVVIARPTLNFAILENRPLSTWEGPRARRRQLGCRRPLARRREACMYAADSANDVAGVVLFGSYCSVDLSDTGIPALTFIGENDELSTEAKIEDAAICCPPTPSS